MFQYSHAIFNMAVCQCGPSFGQSAAAAAAALKRRTIGRTSGTEQNKKKIMQKGGIAVNRRIVRVVYPIHHRHIATIIWTLTPVTYILAMYLFEHHRWLASTLYEMGSDDRKQFGVCAFCSRV